MLAEQAMERRLLVLGATVTAIGFVVAAAGPRDVGGAMLLAGWILFGGALHRYGRLGADELEGPPPTS